MEPHSHFFSSTGENPPAPPPQPPHQSKKHNQIQGPRPAPLKVKPQSRKIKKPPLPPPPQQPLIIYAVSPKTIHTDVSNFMNVIHRLTGLSSGDFSSDGQVSPAARLASTEKASPTGRSSSSSSNTNTKSGGDVDVDVSDAYLMNMVDGLEIGQFPGILSPTPAMLPPVPAGFFSPVTDPNFFNDLIINYSPYGYSGSYAVSPSGLLSGSVVSPLPSPDIFNLLMDF